ncbi:helix-turn-helix domain-containing protein [Pseudomonas helleri]|uniref:helix-turn-helix domain-containing protein n=1 Tax=Pseudomonas helleri TaxID=1608996 RepID=UPI0012954735|nr:transcriptional regulator [Pseudomonas helleri]MQT34851.1 transcriptional regulator [Pseudomonas helleri]
MNRPTSHPNPREIRATTGLNQSEFWRQIFVNQTAASRYESGRPMPAPTAELFRLVHIERIELVSINRVDLLIAAHLKQELPDLYQSLKALVTKSDSETQQ